MATVAHTCPSVIGVDTPARTHTYAVLPPNGGIWAPSRSGTRTRAAPARSLGSPPRERRPRALGVIEGTGSYGALLAGTVIGAGYRVVETPRFRA